MADESYGTIPNKYLAKYLIIMEFSIDIHTSMNGEIILEDFSKEYD